MSSSGRRRRTTAAALALATVSTLGAQASFAVPAAAAETTSFVSDLPRLVAVNGLGPAEKDRSNGGVAPRDGRVLRIGGRTFAKGLGVHAGSSLTYRVPARCSRFTSVAGVDDTVGARGSVAFQVHLGARKVYDSGRRTGSHGNLAVSVPVTGGALLRLVVTDAGDGLDRDHAVWGGARLTCAAGAPTTGLARTSSTERQDFSGVDGTFVSSAAFWSTADRGLRENPAWFSESGTMLRSGATGRTRSDYFRMWTRQRALAFVSAELDVTFRGWVSGDAGWHGVNLWLHAQMCTPVPRCSAVNDAAGGNAGYALDFMNRDGSLTILKKVSGDTRRKHAGAVGHAEGGTYYQLARTTFRPVPGQRYRFTGRSVDNGAGSTTLQVLIDGRVRLSVRDDGRTGGPRLGAGRVGLRSDFADVTVDDLTISR